MYLSREKIETFTRATSKSLRHIEQLARTSPADSGLYWQPHETIFYKKYQILLIIIKKLRHCISTSFKIKKLAYGTNVLLGTNIQTPLYMENIQNGGRGLSILTRWSMHFANCIASSGPTYDVSYSEKIYPCHIRMVGGHRV